MYQFLTKKSHSNPDFCPFGSNCITKETQQEGQQDSKRKGNLTFLSVSVTTQKSEHASLLHSYQGTTTFVADKQPHRSTQAKLHNVLKYCVASPMAGWADILHPS